MLLIPLLHNLVAYSERRITFWQLIDHPYIYGPVILLFAPVIAVMSGTLPIAGLTTAYLNVALALGIVAGFMLVNFAIVLTLIRVGKNWRRN